MKKNQSSRPRDREQTKTLLVEAAVSILEESGFPGLGINSVAEKAGVNKVLIYRYFGGLPGLLRAVAAGMDLTKTRLINIEPARLKTRTELKSAFSEGFYSMHERLKQDKLAMEVMTQDLLEENELTRLLAEVREQQGVEITERIKAMLTGAPVTASSGQPDFNALFAIVSGAIYYLTLRSRTVQMFNGIDIQSREGWQRICETMAAMTETMISSETGS